MQAAIVILLARCNTLGMPQPAPTSIRVPEDREPRLAAFMAQHNIKKRGTAILRLMDLGFQLNDDVPKFVVKAGPVPKSNTSATPSSLLSVPVNAKMRDVSEVRDRWAQFKDAPKADKKTK